MPLQIDPPDAGDIDALIAANPGEDTFEFVTGDYVPNHQIDPNRDGVHLVAQSGQSPRFLGVTTDIHSSWTNNENGTWTRTETASPSDSETDTNRKQAGWYNCSKDYAVWFNEQLGRHMDTLGEVVAYGTSGQYQFYLNDGANQLTINVDPDTLNSLEKSSTLLQVIKSNTADNTTIDGITFAKFVTDMDQQTVDMDGVDNCIVQNCRFEHIWGGAVGLGNGGQAINNLFQWLGSYAVGGNGSSGNRPNNILVQDNTMQYGNLRGSAPSNAGSITKFAHTNNLRVIANLVIGSHVLDLPESHGIWIDIDNLEALVRDNVFKHITGSALYYEISGGDDSDWFSKFALNEYFDCNREVSHLARKGDIFLDNSRNAIVYRNTMRKNANGGYGFGLREGDRDDSIAMGHQYSNRRHFITHNTIWQADSDSRNGFRDYYNGYTSDLKGQIGSSVIIDSNVHHYAGGSSSHDIFSADDQVPRTFAEWLTEGAGANNVLNLVSSGDAGFDEPDYYKLADIPVGTHHKRIERILPAQHIAFNQISGTQFVDYGYISAYPSIPATGWTLNQTGHGFNKICALSDATKIVNAYNAHVLAHIAGRSWSVHVCMKPNDFDNGNQKIWQCGIGDGAGLIQAYMQLRAGGVMRWYINVNGTATPSVEANINAYDDGEFHVFSFEWNTTTNQVLCMVDFTLVGTISSVPANSTSYTIGGRWNYGRQSDSTADGCAGYYDRAILLDHLSTDEDRAAILEQSVAPIWVTSEVEGNETSTLDPVTVTDPDGEIQGTDVEISYVSGTLPEGVTGINSDGTWIGTPSFSAAGVYNITLRATDSFGLQTDQMVTISITASGNANPVIGAIPDDSVAENSTLHLDVTVTDPDSDLCEITLTMENDDPAPAWVTFVDNGDNTADIDFDPAYGDEGTYDFKLTADDLNGGTDTELFTLIVTHTNQVPTIDPIDNVSMNEGATLNHPFTYTDPDGDGTVTVTVDLPNDDPAPAWVGVTNNGDGTGTVDLTPGYGDASAGISLRVTVDDGTASNFTTFAVTVNNVVRLSAIANQTHVVGQVVHIPLIFANPNGTIVWQLISAPGGTSIHSGIPAMVGSIATGADASSPYTVTVEGTDNDDTETRQFTWTVNPIPVSGGGGTRDDEGLAVPGPAFRNTSPIATSNQIPRRRS